MIQKLGRRMLTRDELKELCTRDLDVLFKRIKKAVDKQKAKKKSLDSYKPFISYKALIKEELNLRKSEDITKCDTVIKKEYITLEELGIVFEEEVV